jgi:hypothetical protein
MSDDYYLLITDDPAAVGDIVPNVDDQGWANAATRDPRTVWITDALRGRASSDLVDLVQGHPPQVRVLRVTPAGGGTVRPHGGYVSDPDTTLITHFTPLAATDGWLVRSVEPLETILGPQGEQITAAVRDAAGVVEGGADPEIADAYQAALAAVDDRHLRHASAGAEIALTQCGVDSGWWISCLSDRWGGAILALAARDLLGTTPHWTQAEYDTLTTPWRTVFPAPLHPQDRPVRRSAHG